MESYINTFFFGIYPYIALMVMIVGTLLRYDQAPYSWKADSSQLMRSRGMRIGNNLFHIGIILLFFGHLVGLLTPESIYHVFVTSAQKQFLAMVAGGIFGAICFIGMVMLIWRRLTDPRIRAVTRPSDLVVLFIIFAQLLLGMATIPASAAHSDGSSMVALANWAQYIVTFRPGAADFVLQEAAVFKTHIVLGLTLVLVFPFTRLVHMLSAPIKYFFRSGYQIVRSRG